MLKIALIAVIRKYWLLAISVLSANVGVGFWRTNEVSMPLVMFTLTVVTLALLVVALPVELYKLRKSK